MRIDVITLFPGIFPGPLAESIPGRVLDQGLAADGNGWAYAAMGTSHVGVVNLTYAIESGILEPAGSAAYAVTAQGDAGKLLIVGNSAYLSERCP